MRIVVLPDRDSVSSVAGFTRNVLGRASLSDQFVGIDKSKSVEASGFILCSLVVVVSGSAVSESETGEVSKQDQTEKEKETKDDKTDSPASVINEETEEGEGREDDTDQEQRSQVPSWEVSLDLWVILISQSSVREIGETKTESEEENASDEDQLRDGLVIPLQALEGRSGNVEEVQEEEGMEHDLGNERGIEEAVDRVNG